MRTWQSMIFQMPVSRPLLAVVGVDDPWGGTGSGRQDEQRFQGQETQKTRTCPGRVGRLWQKRLSESIEHAFYSYPPSFSKWKLKDRINGLSRSWWQSTKHQAQSLLEGLCIWCARHKPPKPTLTSEPSDQAMYRHHPKVELFRKFEQCTRKSYMA